MGFCAIVDYGVGNLLSVANAMKFLGFATEITGDPAVLAQADSIILPGVGAFPDAAERLRTQNLDAALWEESERKPILGICLGMQLLFEHGSEGRPCKGLGFVRGNVERIQTDLKLPHIGWNALTFCNDAPLFYGLPDGVYVYFVHSFYGNAEDPTQVTAVTDYGGKVVAAVRSGNVYGTQFHPEKSGDVGLAMLKNFGELNR